MAKKTRSHNEWFRTVSKTTCECGQRKTSVWSWGQYVIGKWHNVMQFCDACVDTRVRDLLMGHGGDCGCEINLVGYGGQTLSPALLKLQDDLNQQHCAMQAAA